MKDSAQPGWLGRICSAFKRGLLGKSSHEYRKQFTGAEVAMSIPRGPAQAAPARLDATPQYEPVHGWTSRQTSDYLARNPAYRSAYEAMLAKREHA